MKTIKYLMFILMLWIRPVVQFLGKISSPVLIIFGILLLIDSDSDPLANWVPYSMILSGFLIFIFLDRYDKLLAFLNPDSNRDLIF